MFAAIRRSFVGLAAELQPGFSSAPRRAFTQCSAGLNELGQLKLGGDNPVAPAFLPSGGWPDQTALPSRTGRAVTLTGQRHVGRIED